MKNKLHGRILVSGACDSACNSQLLYFTCSSLSADDERLYMISDRDGHPNIWVRNLLTGAERMLSRNTKGYLKSYVYFDGMQDEGLG